MIVAVLAGDDEQVPPPRATAPPAPPPETEPPEPTPEPAPPELPIATGLAERNANLLSAHATESKFEPWRARVEALRPRYYRFMVDWSQLQPRRDEPPALEQRDDGCLRGVPPCGEFRGLRDVLRAVRSQQEENGGWEVVTTIYGVPEWAARAPGGCERSTELPRARPMTRAGFEGYRALVRSLLRVAEEEGVELRWWSPWNEPNHPWFISPQRRRCDPRAPSLAARTYARIVRALSAELADHPGDRQLVLGEMAPGDEPTKLVTGVEEMVAALPDDVACAGAVWAQHEYAQRDRARDRGDPIAQLRRALDRRACTRGKPIWVTETGVGGRRIGAKRTFSRRELRADCRDMAAFLRRWARDPRVDAAFQFSFREDNAFPVGLVDTRLTRAYPVYHLWRRAARGRLSCPR